MTEKSEQNTGADQLQNLELPDMSLKKLFSHFGPGIILMMTGIGTSHLITAPTAGGRFEFALLWCIPIAYIFKYYGFEMAFRFTNATGKSIVEAYSTARKKSILGIPILPDKWPLWYVLITTIIQCAIGQSGRLIAASAVLYYLIVLSIGIELPMYIYGSILGVLSVAIILRGKYSAVETVSKIAAGRLVLSSFAVYFVNPA
ncbi:divalent metal cation transporter, partial [candidate division KSB1 bacterium]|nr:divalent metal cation transporter [candidate division KSB1 bacterium]